MADFSLANNPLSNYVRESKEELKKVTWPSRTTVVTHTLVVIGMSLGLAVLLGAFDYLLSLGVEKLITR